MKAESCMIVVQRIDNNDDVRSSKMRSTGT
jgi:hypothetical protein